MIKTNQAYILAGFIFFSFFLPLNIAPLFDLDEGAFSEATREMLVNKDYITTYLNGELRFDKPILIYYFQLLSIKIFGIETFAFRLPSAIASLFWAISIYLFTCKYQTKKHALFATLFFITTLQTTIIAKAAIADALLNLFIALSLFGIYAFYKTKEKAYIYLVFTCIAFGTLTKGPVAILVPLMTSFIFFTLKKEFKLWIKTLLNPLGILIFLVIALPWYLLEYLEQGEKFINGFFLKHNIGRMSSAMEGHGGGFYYFFIVLLIGLLPFTSLAIKALLKFKTLIKDELKLFLLIWFVSVFLFFSFSNTKLPHYIIYGYTPLFILMASFLDENKNSKVWILVPLILLATILLFLPEIVYLAKPYIQDKFALTLIENQGNSFDTTYRLILVFIIIISIWQLLKPFPFKTILIASGFSMTLLVNYAVMPSYGKLMQLPVKQAALFAKNHNLNVVMYKNNMPSFNVYYEGLVSKQVPTVGDVVFSKVSDLHNFKEYKTLFQKGAFALVRIIQ